MNFFAALTCTIFAWGLAEGSKVFFWEIFRAQESASTEHAELTLMTDLEQTSGGAAVSAAPTKQ